MDTFMWMNESIMELMTIRYLPIALVPNRNKKITCFQKFLLMRTKKKIAETFKRQKVTQCTLVETLHAYVKRILSV